MDDKINLIRICSMHFLHQMPLNDGLNRLLVQFHATSEPRFGSRTPILQFNYTLVRILWPLFFDAIDVIIQTVSSLLYYSYLSAIYANRIL